MKAIRIVFMIALASLGILPLRGPSAPEPAPWIGPNEGLAARLRQKGQDPRLVLIWEGYPLHFDRSESISLAGARFEVVRLVQAVEFTPGEVFPPGDCVERYVLIDERGAVQDVATLYWPSFRRHEIESDRCFGDPSAGFLDIRDQMPLRHRNMLPVPFVELGIEPGRTKKVSLSWTGTSKLGRLWIEDRRFRAAGAND